MRKTRRGVDEPDDGRLVEGVGWGPWVRARGTGRKPPPRDAVGARTVASGLVRGLPDGRESCGAKREAHQRDGVG